MQRIGSNRGQLYIQDGYVYRRTHKSSGYGVSYLTCNEPNCPSRARLREGDLQCEHSPHNHPIDEVALEVLFFKQELKRRATTETVRPRVIFNAVSRKYPRACAKMGFQSVKSFMYKHRQQHMLRLASQVGHFIENGTSPHAKADANCKSPEQYRDSEETREQQDSSTFEATNPSDLQEWDFQEQDIHDYQQETTHAGSPNQVRNFPEIYEPIFKDVSKIKEELISDVGYESPELTEDLEHSQSVSDDSSVSARLQDMGACEQDTTRAGCPYQIRRSSEVCEPIFKNVNRIKEETTSDVGYDSLELTEDLEHSQSVPEGTGAVKSGVQEATCVDSSNQVKNSELHNPLTHEVSVINGQVMSNTAFESLDQAGNVENEQRVQDDGTFKSILQCLYSGQKEKTCVDNPNQMALGKKPMDVPETLPSGNMNSSSTSMPAIMSAVRKHFPGSRNQYRYTKRTRNNTETLDVSDSLPSGTMNSSSTSKPAIISAVRKHYSGSRNQYRYTKRTKSKAETPDQEFHNVRMKYLKLEHELKMQVLEEEKSYWQFMKGNALQASTSSVSVAPEKTSTVRSSRVYTS